MSFVLVLAFIVTPVSSVLANTDQQSHDALVQELISLILLRIQDLQMQIAALQTKEFDENTEMREKKERSDNEDHGNEKEDVTENELRGNTKKEKETWQAIYDYEERNDLSGQVIDSVVYIKELDNGRIQIKTYSGSTITTDVSKMKYYKDWDAVISRIK